TYTYESTGVGDVTVTVECMNLTKTYSISDYLKFDDALSDNRSKYDTSRMNLTLEYDNTNKYYYITGGGNNNSYHNYLLIKNVEAYLGYDISFDVKTSSSNNRLHYTRSPVVVYNAPENGVMAWVGRFHSKG